MYLFLPIKKKITSRTKAIFTVDIFGRSSDIKSLKKIVKNKKIKILIDSAQSPYCKTDSGLAGTIGDVGGFSLNNHKIINTGEGGIVVTNNKRIAERVRLLRNHAEITNSYKNKKDLSNMIGFNFRMGEIEAAIGIQQYKKLKKILLKRENLLNLLTSLLKNLKGLHVPPIGRNFFNNFYCYPIVLDSKIINHSRKKIIALLKEKGVQEISGGYANLHLLPVFQKKIAFGLRKFPWSMNRNKINYKKGICPIAEKLHDKELILLEVCMFELNKKDIKFIYNSFNSVWNEILSK